MSALEEAAEVVDHYRRLLVERPPTDKARPAEVIEEEGRRLRASERYPRARGDTRVRYLLLRAHLRTIDFRPFSGGFHTQKAIQLCIDRAKARAKAKKAARADPLAAKTIESTPARNPLAADTTARDPHPIVVPSHNPTDKFAPVQAPVVPSATSTPLCPTTRPEQHSPWDSALHTDYKTVEDEAPQDAATRVMGLSVNPLMGTWDDPTKTIGDVGDTSTSLINFTAKNNEFMIDQLKTTIDGSNSDEHTARFEDENQQSTRGWADVIEEKSPPPAPTEFNAETAETTARKTAERPPKVNQATCSLSHLRIRSGLYLLFKTLAHPSGLLALQDTRASGGLLTLQDIPASERATCSPSHPRVRAGYLLFEPPGHPSGLLALPATSMGSDAIEKSKEGKSDLDTDKDLNFNDFVDDTLAHALARSSRNVSSPAPMENLIQTLADLATEDKAIYTTMGTALANQGSALTNSHGGTMFDPSKAVGDVGDLSDIMPATSVRTLQTPEICEDIAPKGLGSLTVNNDEDLSENVDSILAMSATTSANMTDDTFALDELNDTNENENDKLVFIVDIPVNDEDDSSKCITHLQDEKELDTEEWTAIIEDYHSTDRNDVVVTMGDGMQLQAQYVLCKKILECLYQWDNLTPAIVKYPTELGTLTPSNGPAAGIQLGASEYDADIYSYNDEAMNGPCNLPVFNSFTDEPTTRVVSY